MTHIPNPTGKGGFKDNPENRNTSGRPKGISITEMVKEALEEVEPKTGIHWKDLIIKRILLKATNDGDTTMLKAIWAYIDGMPKQSIDHSGRVDGNIGVEVSSEVKDAVNEALKQTLRSKPRSDD